MVGNNNDGFVLIGLFTVGNKNSKRIFTHTNGGVMRISTFWMSKGQWLICYDYPKRTYKAYTNNGGLLTIIIWCVVSTVKELVIRLKRFLQK